MWRQRRFAFAATPVVFFAGLAWLLPLENDSRLASACCLLQKGQEPRPAQNSAPAKPRAATLDINLASAEDLQTLPGIGPKLAQRIVDYRQKHGPFRRVEDLMVIQGMGVKKWKAVRRYLRVGKK